MIFLGSRVQSSMFVESCRRGKRPMENLGRCPDLAIPLWYLAYSQPRCNLGMCGFHIDWALCEALPLQCVLVSNTLNIV